MSVACVVIAGGTRTQLLTEEVIPSVVRAGFDDVVVVGGGFHHGAGYRYLAVPSLTGTTIDALVKRDVGTLATTADVICYLCDDHVFGSSSVGDVLRTWGERSDWDVLVPSRWARHPVHGLIRVNNGEQEGYCGGHAGVFRRVVVQERPWSAMPHDRLWDLWASQIQQDAGFRFVSTEEVRVQDVEPGAEPWR